MHWTIYPPIVIYFALLAYALIDVQRKRESFNALTYALGSGNYKWYTLFLTIAASMIGPTYTMGVVDQAKSYGFFYTLFFILAMLQIAILGYFFADKIREEADDNIRTIGDIIGKYYNRWGQFFTGLATLGQSLAFSGVLCLGAAKIMLAVWGLPIQYGVVFTALFVSAYSAGGGMPAVIKTDKIQFYFLCAVGVLGIFSSIDIFATSNVILTKKMIWNFDTNQFPTSTVIALFVSFLLGEAFIPIYSVRGLIAVDKLTARKGFLASALFGVVWFLVLTFVGISSNLSSKAPLIGIALFDTIAGVSDNLVIINLIMGFAIAGVLGIIMSTLDSVLNAGAISLIRDILNPIKKLNDTTEYNLGKISLLGIAIFGSVFALYSDNLVDILLLGYTFWVPTVVFPFGYCLLRKKVNYKGSALIGILAGITGYNLGPYFNLTMIPPVLFGFLLNAISLLIAETIASKKTV